MLFVININYQYNTFHSIQAYNNHTIQLDFYSVVINKIILKEINLKKLLEYEF